MGGGRLDEDCEKYDDGEENRRRMRKVVIFIVLTFLAAFLFWR